MWKCSFPGGLNHKYVESKWDWLHPSWPTFLTARILQSWSHWHWQLSAVICSLACSRKTVGLTQQFQLLLIFFSPFSIPSLNLKSTLPQSCVHFLFFFLAGSLVFSLLQPFPSTLWLTAIVAHDHNTNLLSVEVRHLLWPEKLGSKLQTLEPHYMNMGQIRKLEF